MQPFTLAAWQHRNAFTYEGAAKALGLCRAAYARHLKLEREGKPLPKMLVMACKAVCIQKGNPMTLQLKIKKLHPDAVVPKYATAGAACFDLHAIVENDIGADAVLPGHFYTFRTGLAFEVPSGYVLKVYSRSGHGFKYGVRLANGTGIIDSDYRGELMVCLKNDGPSEPLVVHHGDRIAQAMLVQIPQVELIEVGELSNTERGAGGFGSTGA
jgi:dUTP pyrophosphatase